MPPGSPRVRDLQLAGSTADTNLVQDEPTRSQLASRLADAELRLARTQRLASLIEGSPHAAVVHCGGIIRWANDAAAALVDRVVAAEIVGRPIMGFIAPESQADAARRAEMLLSSGSMPDAGMFQLTGAGGRRVAVETRGARIEWDGEPAVHVVLWDVTERRNEATRLAWDASHDALTHLLNRSAVMGHLVDLLRPEDGECSDAGGDVAAVLVDLDGFKAVNDNLGHLVGDRVLACVARRLQRVAAGRPIGRLGGDEFLMVWRPERSGEVGTLASRLVTAAGNGSEDGRHGVGISPELATTASAGAAIARRGTAAAEELVAVADRAMCSAKRQGTGWAIAEHVSGSATRSLAGAHQVPGAGGAAS